MLSCVEYALLELAIIGKELLFKSSELIPYKTVNVSGSEGMERSVSIH